MTGFVDYASTGIDPEEAFDLDALRRVGADNPADATVVRRGDIWLLGDHRLICGDSTDHRDISRLLGRDRPHLMVTDPPYGVDYDPDWRNHATRADGTSYGASATGTVRNDKRADWRAAWRLFRGDVAYVWHAGVHVAEVQRSLEAADFEVRAQIIGVKHRFVISRGHYHWQHEACLYCVRTGGNGHWQGSRDQTTVWQIVHRKSETGHGTQKPLECMRRPIVNSSATGDSVYEPFCGSGTTIIAAEATGRRCLAVEIDPLYAYVSIDRWQRFTGRQTSLQATGEVFAEVLRRRLAEPKEEPVTKTSVPCAAVTTTAAHGADEPEATDLIALLANREKRLLAEGRKAVPE